MPESVLRRGDSLPDDRLGAETRPYLFLRNHDATHRQDAWPARPVFQGSHNQREQFARMRTRLDTSTAAIFVDTNPSIWSAHNYEIHGVPA